MDGNIRVWYPESEEETFYGYEKDIGYEVTEKRSI